MPYFLQRQNLRIPPWLRPAGRAARRAICCFIGCCIFTAAPGFGFQSGLAISAKNSPLHLVLRKIQKQSGYQFFYDNQLIRKARPVSIEFRDGTIQQLMDELLRDQPLTYTILEQTIVLKRKPAHLQAAASKKEDEPQNTIPTRSSGLVAFSGERAAPLSYRERVSKPDLQVNGKVTDENGEPLPGVSVVVRGSTQGTITDPQGSYTLSVPNAQAILVFSFVGYVTQEFPVGSRTVLDVKLVVDEKSLDEVVVVGYGTQKKASVVGAIAQVNGDRLQGAGGIPNLAQALTGQLPGVTTMQTSGEPGADDPSIFIRGRGTWNNAQPLILVDGIERRMNDIDVSEVENISVLKDASATAVYGVKGAEGVILITTKKGRLGKPVISVEANFTTKTLSRVPGKMSSYDQFNFRNKVIEYQLNTGMAGRETNWSEYMPLEVLQYYKQPQDPGMQYIFPDVDWVKEVTKPFPLSSRLNLNVSGGTEFAKYFGSFSYSYDDDIIRTGVDPMNAGYKSKNAYERINFRTNLDLNITKKTVFSTSIAGWIGNKTQAYGNSGALLNIFKAYAELSPDMFPVYHADGSYGYNPNANTTRNPIQLANSEGIGERRRTTVTTDFVLKQDLDFITKGLSARGSFSFDNTFYTDAGIQDGGQSRNLYIDPAIIDMKEGERPEDYMMGYIFTQGTNHDYDWIKGTTVQTAETSVAGGESYRRLFYQAQLNYTREFGKHDVTGLALINREQYAQGSMFPRYREDLVGRVTYGYDNRYFFESNFAYNGSERFGPGYRFGFFPSAALGWNLAGETFIKRPWLDNLKLRYSIGKVGNDNFSAPRWAYQTNWSLETARTLFGYPQATQSPYYQYVEQVIGNPDLSWETSVKQNLGLDVAVLGNRLGLTVDVFRDHRRDVFLSAAQRTVISYFGQNAVSANLGEVKIKGYEIELSYRNTLKNKLGYNISISHTGAFDEIIYMEDAPLLPDYQKNQGFSIGQRRVQTPSGFVNNWDDIYSSTAYQSNNGSKLPGDYRIIDFNGDGVLDAKDNIPYQYPIDRPQHTYNVALGLDYKGFSVAVQFYGIYNITREYTGYIRVPFYNQLTTGPVIQQHTDMWTPENQQGRYRFQRIDYQGTPGSADVQYEDGSYLRLKTAEIAYQLKSDIVRKLGASSIRLFLNGNNLAFWSKMIEDRETRGSNTVDTLYPMTKRFNLGATIKF